MMWYVLAVLTGCATGADSAEAAAGVEWGEMWLDCAQGSVVYDPGDAWVVQAIICRDAVPCALADLGADLEGWRVYCDAGDEVRYRWITP